MASPDRRGHRSLDHEPRDRLLTPNDFDDLDYVRQRLADFERLYNQIAEPFSWNFTRDKLTAWLARLTARETALAG